MPLRAPEHGALEPIDPTLVADDSSVEPANATVEASMPADLADGIDLEGLNIAVTPEGAAEAGDRQTVGQDKLFYADVAEDTDFVAASTSIGMEAFWQLRSPGSPSGTSLGLDLPAGATLNSDGAGGATIEAATGPLARVLAPTAFDANGTPVPVEMTASGDELELRFPHADGDYRYPILVDPVIEDYNWSGGDVCPAANTANPTATYWHWETNASTNFGAGCNNSGATGILNQGHGNKTFGVNDFAQWVWRSPPNTRIFAADYFGTRHVSQSSCATFGIYLQGSPIGHWQSSNAGSSTRCQSWAASDKSFTVTDEFVDGNLGVMQLLMPTAGLRTAASQQWVPHAAFSLTEDHAPTITQRPSSTGIWTEDGTVANPATLTQTIGADDAGLGVKKFWFFKPKMNDPESLELVLPPERPCSGTRGWTACTVPTSWSQNLSYTLPEGRNQVTFMAFDQVGNADSYTYERLVDRSKPTATLSGGLVNSATAVASTGVYRLTVDASDGAPSPDSAMRSGVAAIRVFLDNESEPIFQDSQPCSTHLGGCPRSMTRTFTFDLTANDEQMLDVGLHTVHVEVEDALGHVRSGGDLDLDVMVREDDEAPATEVIATPPRGTSPWSLDLVSSDGQSATNYLSMSNFGSGVSTAEIYFDGELEATVDPAGDCDFGGCGATAQRWYPASSWPPDDLVVRTIDRAGNVDIVQETAGPLRYERYGFNDSFLGPFRAEQFGSDPDPMQTMLDRATAPGASQDPTPKVIRFPINWCSIAEQTPDNPRGASAQWNQITSLMNKVRTANNGDGPSLQVVPMLLGSPTWTTPSLSVRDELDIPCAAYDDPSDDTHKLVAAPPPDPQYVEAAWKTFVGEVLDRFGPEHVDPDNGAVVGDDDYGLLGIEVWNEPNLYRFWGGTANQPGRFAGLVESTRQAILQRFSSAPDAVGLVAGALSPPQRLDNEIVTPTRPYTANLLTALTPATRADLDAVSIHLYADQVIRDDRATERMKTQVASILGGYSDAGVSVPPESKRWITEIGVRTDGFYKGRQRPNGSEVPARPRGPKIQRRRLCDAFFAFGPKVGTFIVHNLYHESKQGTDEPPKFGLWGLPTTQEGKPIYYNLKALAAGRQVRRCTRGD